MNRIIPVCAVLLLIANVSFCVYDVMRGEALMAALTAGAAGFGCYPLLMAGLNKLVTL